MQKLTPLKIVIAGDGGTGKSSLMSARKSGHFVPSSKITIGVNIECFPLEIETEKFQAMVYDLGGQERFHFMHDAYIIGCKGAIVVYDLTRPQTLFHVPYWIELITKVNPNIPIILGGSKKDLATSDNIKEILKMWEQVRLSIKPVEHNPINIYFSSKTLEGVEEIFTNLGKAIVNQNEISCESVSIAEN